MSQARLFLSILVVALSTSHAADTQSVRDRDRSRPKKIEKVPELAENRIPNYRLIKPRWSFSLKASPYAFSANYFSGLVRTNATSILGALVGLGYQPRFIQEIGFGVVGLEFQGGMYPVAFEGAKYDVFSVWTLGGLLRYQAHFWDDQFLVPSVGYSMERVQYWLSDGSRSNLFVHGPVFNVFLFLSDIDSDTSASLHRTAGVTRTYFVAEWRLTGGSDSFVQLAGSTIFLGLRFEKQ